MKKVCVVLDGLGTATSIGAIKGLGLQADYDLHIIGLDSDPLCSGAAFVDEFLVCPLAKDEGFTEFCLDIVRSREVGLWIPVIDYAFEKYAALKDEFQALGCCLMIGSSEAITVCTSKWRTFELFERLSVPVPATFLPHDFKPMRDVTFITKPDVGGRSSIDVESHESGGEVLEFLSSVSTKRSNNTVIQEKVDGLEFTVDCLATLDGDIVQIFARSRLETKGGLSVKAEALSAELNDRIFPFIKIINDELRLPGVFNVQGFVANDGGLQFFEVNPRFAGGHPFTIASGLNSAAHLLEMLDGTFSSANINIRYDLKMARYWSETFWSDNGRVDVLISPQRRGGAKL